MWSDYVACILLLKQSTIKTKRLYVCTRVCVPVYLYMCAFLCVYMCTRTWCTGICVFVFGAYRLHIEWVNELNKPIWQIWTIMALFHLEMSELFHTEVWARQSAIGSLLTSLGLVAAGSPPWWEMREVFVCNRTYRGYKSSRRTVSSFSSVLHIPQMTVFWVGMSNGVDRTGVILDFLKQELWVAVGKKCQ